MVCLGLYYCDALLQQKFSDEIVHMIGYMGAQQKKQLDGLEELAMFTEREMRLFMTNIHPFLLEQLHQTVAKASLALKWLNEDVAIFDGSQEISSLSTSIESISVQVCSLCECRCLLQVFYYIAEAASARADWI